MDYPDPHRGRTRGGHGGSLSPRPRASPPPVPFPHPYPADERPSSEQMTDLHIYIVPAQYWNEQYNCAYNTVMNYTISAGFIRVYPETALVDLRGIVIDQIGKQGGTLPKKFIFLKSVGRAMTQVKHMQEKQLKVKNFLPPFAYCPEIFIMSRDPIGESDDEDGMTEEEKKDLQIKKEEAEKKRQDLDKKEQELEKKKREEEKERFKKEQEIEKKLREQEKEMLQKQRELEKKLAEEQKQLEDEKMKNEREIDEQRRKMERELEETKRNVEKEMEEQQRKNEKEFDERMREHEKRIQDQQNELEKRILEQEAAMRKKIQDQERALMEKERDIEREKMELEKKAMEQEKEILVQQNEIEKQKMETEKDKARLEQRKKMQQDNEKLAQLSGGIMPDFATGKQSDRPGTSPSKMRFPRPASPQLREDLQIKMMELKGLREERREMEEFRAELIKKAKTLQIKAHSKRAAARDHWKKKYFDEKKKSAPLDEHLAKLRRELDTLNRRQIGRLEKEMDANPDPANVALVQNKILLSRLTHEIEELKWRVEESKMRLTADLKLRMQAQNELKVLRAEVTQKKINAGMQRELQRTAIQQN